MRYDPDWLCTQLEQNNIMDIVNKDWPLLFIDRLNMPKGLCLSVGWTGKSASTSERNI